MQSSLNSIKRTAQSAARSVRLVIEQACGHKALSLAYLFTQAALIALAFLSLSSAQTRVKTISVERDSVPQLLELSRSITQLGEYRGSCTSVLLTQTGSPLSLRQLCEMRHSELMAVLPELPDYQNMDASTFFNAVTRVVGERLSALDSLYEESGLALDPTRSSHSLSTTVFRLYPVMIDLVGQARGMLALIQHGGVELSSLHSVEGKIALLEQLHASNMSFKASHSDSGVGNRRASIGGYLETLEKIITERGESSTAGIPDYFKAGTDLIASIVADFEKQAEQLSSLLQQQHSSAKFQRDMSSGLFIFLQLALLVLFFKLSQYLASLQRIASQEQDSRQRLELLMERQKEMFAVIGHELRTPVAAIDMLIDDEDQSDLSKLAQVKMLNAGLVSVLDDLRVVVAPERALETKLENGDPSELIEQALISISGLVQSRGMKIHAGIKPSTGLIFSLQLQPLRQIVINLVKNAALHSGGQHAYLFFDFTEIINGESQAILRVADDGEGIPVAEQLRMFEPFERGVNHKSTGSGLGLFIVKQLVDLLEGEISFHNSDSGGACFEIRFPMRVVASNASLQPENWIELRDKRILIAEDELMLRMLTEKLLAKQGATVVSAEDGDIALKYFHAEHFDLVITDLMMPHMDGLELTRRIRSSDPHTPIIALTAAVLGSETDQFLLDGANAVMSKPLTLIKLHGVLAKVLTSTPDEGA